MRRFFQENLILKIAALALAVILWFFVTSKGQTEISLNVPIEYAKIIPGLEIARRGAETASIVIRGHESFLRNIRRGDVRVYVDVSRAKEGEDVFYIKKDDVRLPFAAEVTRIEPSTVRVLFEKTASKEVAVRPAVTGSPEKGYYVKAVEVRPDKLLVEGAKSEVRKIISLKTEPIDITGLTEDFVQEVGLDLSGRHIRTRTDKANVSIRIVRRGR